MASERYVSSAWSPHSVLRNKAIFRTKPISLLTPERKISKQHGDLSNLRPRSPPLSLMSSGSYHVSIHARPDNWGDCISDTEVSDNQVVQPLASVKVAAYPNHDDRLGLLDMFMPTFSSHNSNNQVPKHDDGRPSLIKHLDVITTWTHLSLENAEILHEMQQALIPSLEYLLGWQLEELDLAARREALPFQRDGFPNVSLMYFNLIELVQVMLDTMQLYHCEHVFPKSPDYLTELMVLFFISEHCLESAVMNGEAENATVLVQLTPGLDLASHIVPPSIAHIIPSLDRLTFFGLDPVPREGTKFILIPQYRRGAFTRSSKEYTRISYEVIGASWLEWDDGIGGYKGEIPMFSNLRPRLLGNSCNTRIGPYAVVRQIPIEVKAVLTERHSQSSVRLKRTVRSRVTLSVIPWWADKSEIPASKAAVVSSPMAKHRRAAQQWSEPSQEDSDDLSQTSTQEHFDPSEGSEDDLEPKTAPPESSDSGRGSGSSTRTAAKYQDPQNRFSSLSSLHSISNSTHSEPSQQAITMPMHGPQPHEIQGANRVWCSLKLTRRGVTNTPNRTELQAMWRNHRKTSRTQFPPSRSRSPRIDEHEVFFPDYHTSDSGTHAVPESWFSSDSEDDHDMDHDADDASTSGTVREGEQRARLGGDDGYATTSEDEEGAALLPLVSGIERLEKDIEELEHKVGKTSVREEQIEDHESDQADEEMSLAWNFGC